MENASKALIIAGAILLAILIIALGVFIFQRAQNSASDLGGLDETKVQSVNQKYENYEGSSVTGSDVRALMTKVRTNNNTYGAFPGTDETKDDQNRGIKISFKNATAVGTAGALADMKTSIVAGKNYKVKISKHHTQEATRGLVEEITITENP